MCVSRTNQLGHMFVNLFAVFLGCFFLGQSLVTLKLSFLTWDLEIIFELNFSVNYFFATPPRGLQTCQPSGLYHRSPTYINTHAHTHVSGFITQGYPVTRNQFSWDKGTLILKVTGIASALSLNNNNPQNTRQSQALFHSVRYFTKVTNYTMAP